ncbi:MAG: potassium-transporting ATPase subunit KdpC [Anaerolineaceae bacterium]|nr:potassium-transporting ATPase subunit KdpC [Anaerolineaceae bacterium]NTV37487.1 potassium-transporting ATPase subunit KdpC [Anaerolineaceae bacterium]
MLRTIKTAVALFVFFTLLTGVVYPLVLTGIAQVVFPYQANGSIIKAQDGSQVGSALIGQSFTSPNYFWGRLSATADHPYNAVTSGGSNYSVLNDALQKEVEARISALRLADPGNTAPIPVDLVTSSASGLDPHISPAAAYYQVARIARERGFSEEKVRALVQQNIEAPVWGIFGEPRVNVLMLNLALDSLQ